LKPALLYSVLSGAPLRKYDSQYPRDICVRKNQQNTVETRFYE
jgi:hypothetical protein